MRHEKTVIIKDPRLRKIRNGLRKIYFYHYLPTASRYSGEKPTDKKAIMTKENSKIFNNSICNCRSCFRMDRDMIYNKHEGRWYCLDCYYSIKARNTDPADWPLSRKEIRIFLRELAGPEGCQYNGREWRCGGKEFTYARRALDLMEIPKATQEEFLTFCRAFGGYCDCEILMNAAPYLLGEETPY